MPTTSYGYELTIGDDTDRDDVPICCGEDMTGKDAARGNREYSCGCGTKVTIAPSGLVFDITD
ncbi:hypothetical protein [Streptomyces lancefieldiae]|uniref:Uncharacterized protein n=1 Tax=Streptomyces lancefieldiae TaxID=3075520 RepID=A0ABU3AF81_9ACTN|nr:hypothetical protein [Streptomyces sp. DSM 40712]MDT0608846.1 hypothetical protein [Streptomyces sp. DSM 40712]